MVTLHGAYACLTRNRNAPLPPPRPGIRRCSDFQAEMSRRNEIVAVVRERRNKGRARSHGAISLALSCGAPKRGARRTTEGEGEGREISTRRGARARDQRFAVYRRRSPRSHGRSDR